LKHKMLLDETGARLKSPSTAADTIIGDTGMVCQACWLFGASLDEICALILSSVYHCRSSVLAMYLLMLCLLCYGSSKSWQEMDDCIFW
jgi:hypothetical protein